MVRLKNIKSHVSIYLFSIFIFISNLAQAQSFDIISSSVEVFDISANTESRNDLNGEKCGLIKVRCVLEGISFKGNIIGNVEFKEGEYWVYLSNNSKKLKIYHSKLLPLDIDLEKLYQTPIKSSCTYFLTLSIPEILYNSLISEQNNGISDSDNLLSENENIDDSKLSMKIDSLKEIVFNIKSSLEEVQSTYDLSGFNEEKIGKSIEQYTLSRRDIKALGIDDVEELDKVVKQLENLASLYELLNRSRAVMRDRCYLKENFKLTKQIEFLDFESSTTEDQRNYIKSILIALQNQGKAINHFCSILGYLADLLPCIPDEATRNELHLDEYIIKKVTDFNEDLYPFNPNPNDTYDTNYTQLNAFLKQLLDDLRPESKTPITKFNVEEKFQSYLNSIANSVRYR